MWSVKSLLLRVFQLLLLLLFFYQSYTIRKKYLRRDVQVILFTPKFGTKYAIFIFIFWQMLKYQSRLTGTEPFPSLTISRRLDPGEVIRFGANGSFDGFRWPMDKSFLTSAKMAVVVNATEEDGKK